MTKTISQLFNGNLIPIKNFGKNNSEIKYLEILLDRNIENLEQSLTENQKEVFSKYYDCINEYLSLLIEQAFSDGFSVATKLLTEAISGAENLQ